MATQPKTKPTPETPVGYQVAPRTKWQHLGEVAPFALIHILCFAAIWTGVHARDVMICLGLYLVRMFGVTAGYHRYFSHKTYKMGRVAQFCMAFLAQSSLQRGVLWWAGKHRHHHKHSDAPPDVHSPVQDGFWWSHFGWFLIGDHLETDPKIYKEYKDYPELIWLDKHPHLPGTILGIVVLLTAGWSGLVVGFFWSTVLLWHGTFTINSLSHVIGSRRYETKDDSRNNWLLALITLGEGWHNNHHYYQSSTRQGFFWWEIDISYYTLKLLSYVGLVWDLREPPRHIVEGRPSPRRAAVKEATDASSVAAVTPSEEGSLAAPGSDDALPAASTTTLDAPVATDHSSLPRA